MLNIFGPQALPSARDTVDGYLPNESPVSIKIKLFQNNFTPSPTSVLADFTEATFDGYAPVTVLAAAYPPSRTMPDGSTLALFSSVADFEDSGNVTPNTIYGAYITDTAGTFLLLSVRFDTPKIMDADMKFIKLEYGILLIPAGVQLTGDVTSNG